MGKLFAGWNGLPFQLIAQQLGGIDREQHHVIQIAVEPPMGGLQLMGPAEMDEALLLQGAAAGGALITALLAGVLPLVGQRQVIQPLW